MPVSFENESSSISDNDRHEDFQEVLKEFPSCGSERHLYVLKMIELDNLRDIEDPYLNDNVDYRVNKINLMSRSCVPDLKLRKMKFTFQDANFWYVKGCRHSEKLEMDSAIDSYRQAIRLDSKHTEAMQNLACQHELQQRFELACKWFKTAIIISPD